MSVRALRVYERHGLVHPARTAADWRVYGPEQFSQLHQVLALKRFGLKLAQIAELVHGNTAPLDRLLALQEDELLRRQQQAGRALTLVRDARKRIAEGKALRLDEIIALIKETRMPDAENISPKFWDLWSNHVRPRAVAVHPDWLAGAGERFGAEWLTLIAEAERLKNTDPEAPQALDLARRALSFAAEFTRFDPELMASVKAVFREGFADPEMVPHMPYSPEVRRFMDAAVERLHAIEKTDSEQHRADD